MERVADVITILTSTWKNYDVERQRESQSNTAKEHIQPLEDMQ